MTEKNRIIILRKEVVFCGDTKLGDSKREALYQHFLIDRAHDYCSLNRIPKHANITS